MIAAPAVQNRSIGGYGSLRSRSEEHTSELQSRLHLVCRLLLEKKNQADSRRRHDRTRRPKQIALLIRLRHVERQHARPRTVCAFAASCASCVRRFDLSEDGGIT